VAEWSAEEIGELLASEGVGQQLDALFDLLGIVLMGIAHHGASAIHSAYTAYRASQMERGRPLDTPHQAAIAAMMLAMTTRKDLGVVTRFLTTRAKRHDAATTAAYLKEFRERAAAFKAARRADNQT
jgi:hypothetical protein